MKNEFFAIHLNGELLSPDVWKEYSKNYGLNGLHGWRPPKRIYYKIHHAKNGVHHLPEQIKHKVEIVRYVPVKEDK